MRSQSHQFEGGAAPPVLQTHLMPRQLPPDSLQRQEQGQEQEQGVSPAQQWARADRLGHKFSDIQILSSPFPQVAAKEDEQERGQCLSDQIWQTMQPASPTLPSSSQSTDPSPQLTHSGPPVIQRQDQPVAERTSEISSASTEEGQKSSGAAVQQLLNQKQPAYARAQQGTQLSNDSERLIYELRHEISAAASSYPDIDAGLIAAILYDEDRRRGFEDTLQDIEARFIIEYEGLLEDAEVFLWETTTGRSVEEQTFGQAQMQPQVVEELVNQGYIQQPQNWVGDELDRSLELLINRSEAPTLVGARLQQTVDHWRNGGQDISGRPEILGTLYSLGLTGSSGVNPNPQPNSRGTEIANSIPRMEQILGMP